ncbi:hypothetical protein AAV95_10575 [Mycolicibacterium elephantis]|uniref:DUF5994 family protein n=1 Tax=Mycolicibacterium elephantis TaxID=81858 RepID=UPI00062979A8|nr:DUF5994 family protein [Mycolicibacterium elephantis]KKW64696.1 hypothetical protein AAV95_10575 [Mycolicibacterium elephantis]OBB23956.1 hypothetical protein A5762_12385 [Mycolicibacterium elephantis]
MVHITSQRSNTPRLVLCDRGRQTGAVDGVWWPPSADLRSALPDLVAVFGRLIGPVRRVVYDPAIWPHAPSRIIRGNTMVAVDPYSLVASDTIYLIGTHSRDAVLYVLPPSSSRDMAGRLLRTVDGADGPMSADMLRQLANDISDVEPTVASASAIKGTP